MTQMTHLRKSHDKSTGQTGIMFHESA